MSQLRIHILLLMMAMVMVGCRDDDDVVGTKPDVDVVDMPLRFSATSTEERQTRGTLIGYITEDADNPNDDYDKPGWWSKRWIKGDAFSAFGVYYFDNMTILGQQFMEGQEVTFDKGGDGKWTYSPIMYWPNQGYLDFFAQYPSAEIMNTIFWPEDMEEDFGLGLGDMADGGSLARQKRVGGRSAVLPYGISSLRFWHENPLDTTVTFRYYCLQSDNEPPQINDMDHPLENIPITTTYNDAAMQPDLMFAHRPHVGKMAVNTDLNYAFTHSMMAVRFWLRGVDGQNTDDPASNYTKLRNLANFTINSVSFGPVYSGGEVIAFDNTDWTKYYKGLNEATQTSSEPVKLRYLWNFGSRRTTAANGDVNEMVTPAYGGFRRKYNKDDGSGEWKQLYWPIAHEHLPMDEGYEIAARSDVFNQTCNVSKNDENVWEKVDLGDEWTAPAKSIALLPEFADNRNIAGREQSAFIFPPQFFDPNTDYVRVMFTITGDDGVTFTHTLKARIPMSDRDNWWDAERKMLRVEDGQILDIYLTFEIDGDNYFRFYVDSYVGPLIYGGGGGIDLGGW